MCDCTNGQVAPDTEKGHNAITFHLILKIKALLFHKMSWYTIPVTQCHISKVGIFSITTLRISNPIIFPAERGSVQDRWSMWVTKHTNTTLHRNSKWQHV